MADKKTELLYQFYQQCQEKGYTDMKDATQSLKAKVIATDLGLKYTSIEKLYQSAIAASEVMAREEQARQAEQERIAVNGKLLFSLDNNWKVYGRQDGSLYVDSGKQRYDGKPRFSIVEGKYKKYTYHGPTSTYNAISYNGMTTGWVDNHPDYFTHKEIASGKGKIFLNVGSIKHEVRSVQIPEGVCRAFKRDERFNALVKNGSISCTSGDSSSEYFRRALQTYSVNKDLIQVMDAQSYSEVIEQASLIQCNAVVMLLERIMNGQYPPSDEQIYRSALDLAEKPDSESVKQAIRSLELISDYQDAAQRIPGLQTRYEQLLQGEKEKAILQKEASAKKTKTVLSILIPAAVLALAAWILMVSVILPGKAYKDAEALQAAGQYEEAIAAFRAMNGYKDSQARIQQLQDILRENTYQHAVELQKSGDYLPAIRAFIEASTYYEDENTEPTTGPNSDDGNTEEKPRAYTLEYYKDSRERLNQMADILLAGKEFRYDGDESFYESKVGPAYNYYTQSHYTVTFADGNAFYICALTDFLKNDRSPDWQSSRSFWGSYEVTQFRDGTLSLALTTEQREAKMYPGTAKEKDADADYIYTFISVRLDETGQVLSAEPGGYTRG